MDLLDIAIVVAALVIGGLLGWFFGNKPVADWKSRHEARDGEARELESNFKAAAAELGAAQIRVATLEANEENFGKQLTLMKEAREEMLAQFKATGGEVLDEVKKDFLKSADERFGHAEKASKVAVANLLKPVDETLRSYKEQVESLEAKRADAFSKLDQQIEGIMRGQELVRSEAQRLGDSLRNAPKVRGRWGEQALKNVLQQCGLTEYTDFITEVSVNTEAGRLRPDALVRIPGEKTLVIDAKVSLNAYQDAFDAPDDAAREKSLSDHLKSMKTHINQLGSKDYQGQFDDAPDYVVMFVPGEHFISAAMEQDAKIRRAKFDDPDLWTYAFDRGVLLASPTNLVAIARSIHQMWGQVKLAEEAKDIAKLGGLLFDSLTKTQKDLHSLGSHLGRAVKSYNEFAKTYDGNAMSRARRLGDKQIQSNSNSLAAEIPLVENSPSHGDD